MLGKTLSAAAFALLAAAPANATCTLANIGGTWSVYSAGIAVPPEPSFFWFECGLAINTAGKITAGSCADSEGMVSPVSGSVRLTVPANCVFTGALELIKFKAPLTINHVTLSLDKQTVLGVASDTGQRFRFNMVKVK